ncbi:hypothetical protein RTBOTA2_006928 [Rhodotorula toruloides]|nr:hypothetical protein RTBOTA2_006928 [Rhodotorula toruloides]
MDTELPELPSALAQRLEEAPQAKRIVLNVRRLLSTLLKLDGGSGLALITLRLAELATERDREAQHDVDALRRHEYREAFRRGEPQTHRLQIESLAGEIVQKSKTLVQLRDEAPGNEKETRGRAYLAFFLAHDWLVGHLLRDFFIELEELVGDERYRRLARGLDRLPIGAASFSLTKRFAGGAEGGYRRARIYGL